MKTKKERIINLCKAGAKNVEITDHVGVSAQYVSKILKQCGLKKNRDERTEVISLTLPGTYVDILDRLQVEWDINRSAVIRKVLDKYK